jgi:hypothetical protein
MHRGRFSCIFTWIFINIVWTKNNFETLRMSAKSNIFLGSKPPVHPNFAGMSSAIWVYHFKYSFSRSRSSQYVYVADSEHHLNIISSDNFLRIIYAVVLCNTDPSMRPKLRPRACTYHPHSDLWRDHQSVPSCRDIIHIPSDILYRNHWHYSLLKMLVQSHPQLARIGSSTRISSNRVIRVVQTPDLSSHVI